MDIVAHALYTNAIYKGAQKSRRSWREIAEIVFWSDFPDIATFGAFGIYNYIAAGFRYLPGSEYAIPPGWESVERAIYSLPIFFGAFALIWILRKQPYWPIGGWGIHIAIDMFTHSNFFPPEFLWPFSDFHFEGISWDTPWFWFVTYAILTVVYAYWFFDLRKREPRAL